MCDEQICIKTPIRSPGIQLRRGFSVSLHKQHTKNRFEMSFSQSSGEKQARREWSERTGREKTASSPAPPRLALLSLGRLIANRVFSGPLDYPERDCWQSK